MNDERRAELAEACYECTGYGDDYYLDGEDNWVCACDDCWVTMEMEIEGE